MPEAVVKSHYAMEAIDSLIVAFQSKFGMNWYPPQDVFNTMFYALDAFINSPSETTDESEEYEAKLLAWRQACKPFVECVYMTITSPIRM